MFEKAIINEKEAGVGPFLKNGGENFADVKAISKKFKYACCAVRMDFKYIERLRC